PLAAALARAPASPTSTPTLSLHDALPIYQLLLGNSEHRDVRAAELVNRLLAVSHDAQVRRLQGKGEDVGTGCEAPRAALPAFGEQGHQLQLEPVGVLELVHEQHPTGRLRLTPRPGMVPEQIAGED